MVKGFSCIKGFGTGEGDKHDFKYCLQDCKNKCLSLPFLATTIDNVTNNVRSYGDISVTSILGCLREVFLSYRDEYYPVPKDLWFTTRGSLLHGILEPIKERVETNEYLQCLDKKRFIVEQRFYYSFNRELEGKQHTITLSGKIDHYDKETNTLIDFKSCNDNGIRFILDGCKPEHEMQANIYRFLLEKTGHKVDNLVISYFSMSGIYETGTKATITTKSKEDVEYFIPAVKILDTTFIQNLIEERAFELYKAYFYNIPPPICEPDMQKWKCSYGGNPYKGYCRSKLSCEYWKKLEQEYIEKTKGE